MTTLSVDLFLAERTTLEKEAVYFDAPGMWLIYTFSDRSFLKVAKNESEREAFNAQGKSMMHTTKLLK